MRLRFLVVGLVCLSVGGPALADTPAVPTAGAALNELPRAISCQAGHEESFGDRPATYYRVEVDWDRRASRPSAVLTSLLNDGQRPYYGRVLTQRRVGGKLERRGAGLAFVTEGWTLVISPGATTRNAELRLDGRKIAARCVMDRAKETGTPAVELMRSTEFQNLRLAARDALSDQYQLRYGPIATVASGDRLRVQVALRKVRSHECSSLPTTRRLPFASVLATLRRVEDDTVADGTRWDVEHLELKITDPSPPPANTPSAEDLAAALFKHYGGARTLEARFRVLASSRGIFSIERSAGLLRADTARGVSVRTDAYRQIEKASGVFRYHPVGRPTHKNPMVDYRLALPFLGTELGERFELARSRSEERCSGDYVLVATPKRKDPILERVSFFFDRSSLTLRSVSVVTIGEDYSIDLERQKVGLALPDEEFELVPPAGYELDRTLR